MNPSIGAVMRRGGAPTPDGRGAGAVVVFYLPQRSEPAPAADVVDAAPVESEPVTIRLPERNGSHP